MPIGEETGTPLEDGVAAPSSSSMAPSVLLERDVVRCCHDDEQNEDGNNRKGSHINAHPVGPATSESALDT